MFGKLIPIKLRQRVRPTDQTPEDMDRRWWWEVGQQQK